MKIASLGYVGLETTDLERWRSFGTQVLGMEEVAGPDAELYLKMDAYPWRLSVATGERDGFAFAGWEFSSQAAFEEAKKELGFAGIQYQQGSADLCARRRVRDLISLRDPAGNLLELVWGLALDYHRLHSPVGVSEFVTGHNGDMGLGHIVFPCREFEETVDFYTRVLGFEITDYLPVKLAEDAPEQGLYFLHCDNPRHHSLALFENPNPAESGLVHMMVEVPTIDELGLCRARCQAVGVPLAADIGRHANDRMLSIYIQSPGGFALEYGCEGLQLDWSSYTPTVSSTASTWGHDWSHGG